MLPEDIVKAVLEKIGYVATTATEFSLVKKRNNEETKQTAFEIFLARIECEAILEMTNEEAQGSLERSLQQGTQTQQHQGEEDEEHQTPQRGDTDSLGHEGSSETPLCPAPLQKGSAPCAASFGAAGSVRITGAVAQPAAAASPSSLQQQQRQSMDSVPGKGSDSEDFLIKYSDIVIAQTPIFSESLSPQALGKEPRARLSEERALAGPAELARALGPAPLSPGASGPPAFAMFADSSCGSKTTLEFEAPGVPEGSIEAEINDAINCIDPAPGDEPTELKSLPYKDFASAQNCSVPREEDICELSLTFTELQIKDAQEELMYPVEESGQPEAVAYAGTSDRHVREFSCSPVKHTYLTDADLHKRAASHPEPPAALCCTAGHTEDATAGSDSKRLFMDPAKGHSASECFRHVREPPNLTYIPPQSIDVQPSPGGRRGLGQAAGACAGGRGGRLEHCSSQETDSQEPYVIIDRTEQAGLSHHS